MSTKQAVYNNGCSKRSSSSRERERDRDKKKLLLSGESGASSQCDTPPLIERDGTSSQGKFAGVSSESIQIMAEQFMPDSISSEACANLAEDVSFRLKQLIHNLSIHTKHMKKMRVDVNDVNSVLKLMDTGPILGAGLPLWLPLGDQDNLCIPHDPLLDTSEVATTFQIYSSATPPTVSASWLPDCKNNGTGNIMSATLFNYFQKISDAITGNNYALLNLALRDLRDNPRIGQIVTNFLNLAILVLTEETLSSVILSSKTTIHKQILDMIACLCGNICCDDINVKIQLQQLYPILITHVLGGGPLSEQMCQTILYLASAWPNYIYIGETLILEYLSQGVEQRLSGPLVDCLVALGRQPLLSCIGPYLQTIDNMIHNTDANYFLYRLPESMLDASNLLLQPYPYEVDKEFVYLDTLLYDILGDSVLPRRFICKAIPQPQESPNESDKSGIVPDLDVFAPKPFKKKQIVRIQKYFPTKKEKPKLNESVFENVYPAPAGQRHFIRFSFAGCRPQQHQSKSLMQALIMGGYNQRRRLSQDVKVNIAVANGLLLKFKYKLPTVQPMPQLYTYIL